MLYSRTFVDLTIGVIFALVVGLYAALSDIRERQQYTTCEAVGLGERTKTTIHPDKGTIVIYCGEVAP